MKAEYEKPAVEQINFLINEPIASQPGIGGGVGGSDILDDDIG